MSGSVSESGCTRNPVNPAPEQHGGQGSDSDGCVSFLPRKLLLYTASPKPGEVLTSLTNEEETKPNSWK